MAADDGPRIAALAFDGWDTHANEGGPVGRLAQLLSGLDGALAEFESGLAGRWRDTVVVVATEFGRTARINGTEGTDHGTGTIALLAGGAVNGGRVISDWPGLKPANLYEGVTSRRPPTCAPLSRACCATISALPSACWRRPCFPTARR